MIKNKEIVEVIFTHKKPGTSSSQLASQCWWWTVVNGSSNNRLADFSESLMANWLWRKGWRTRRFDSTDDEDEAVIDNARHDDDDDGRKGSFGGVL